MVRAQDPHRRLENDDRRADANRSAPVAPARTQVVAGDEGSPDEEEEQQPFEHELSGHLAGLALRIPARPGPGPDPPEAHRPAAIRGGLDAHRDAGMLGMGTLPGGADTRVVARSPARIHRSEAVQIQAGLAKERSPVGFGCGRRIPLALGRDDGEHPEPSTGIQRDLSHARLQRGRVVSSHLRQRKRPGIRGRRQRKQGLPIVEGDGVAREIRAETAVLRGPMEKLVVGVEQVRVVGGLLRQARVLEDLPRARAGARAISPRPRRRRCSRAASGRPRARRPPRARAGGAARSTARSRPAPPPRRPSPATVSPRPRAPRPADRLREARPRPGPPRTAAAPGPSRCSAGSRARRRDRSRAARPREAWASPRSASCDSPRS